MKTNKIFAALCVVIIAVVLVTVLWTQKNNADNQVKALNEQISSLEEQLESVKKSAEEAAAASAQELESVKAAAEASAQELEIVKAEAEASARELESAKTKADELAQELEQAKAEASASAQELERVKAAASASMQELERALANASSQSNEQSVPQPENRGEDNQEPVEEETVPVAMILYENNAHDVRVYSDHITANVTASTQDIRGEGTYTVGLAFDQPAEGLYFMALCVENGETRHPGWVIGVKELKVNGQPVEVGKIYTTSDDGVCTRVNLYNEWVGELPEDARAVEGDLQDASSVAVNPEDFAAVNAVEITFDYLNPGEAS